MTHPCPIVVVTRVVTPPPLRAGADLSPSGAAPSPLSNLTLTPNREGSRSRGRLQARLHGRLARTAGGEGAVGTLEKTLQYDPPAQRIALPAAGLGGDPAPVPGSGINGRVCHGTDIARGTIHEGTSGDGGYPAAAGRAVPVRGARCHRRQRHGRTANLVPGRQEQRVVRIMSALCYRAQSQCERRELPRNRRNHGRTRLSPWTYRWSSHPRRLVRGNEAGRMLWLAHPTFLTPAS